MSADQDTIKSSTLRNLFIQKAEGLISVFTPLPNSFGFSLGSLCDAQQPIAKAQLFSGWKKLELVPGYFGLYTTQ